MARWPTQNRSAAAEPARFPMPLAVWMGINGLDALLTFYLLGIGGTEGNPMLAFLMGQGGGELMLAVKLGLALVAGLTIWSMDRLSLLSAASRLMSLVVVYNVVLLGHTLWM